MARKKFYGVRIGRVPGVYDSWEACKCQVERCKNDFRGFGARDEAAFYVATGRSRDEPGGEALFVQWKRIPQIEISTDGIKQEEKPRIKTEPFDSSQSFFSQVPYFEPDDNADFEDEFSRFASSQNIEPGSQTWRRKRTQVVRQRERKRKLRVYQNMCREAKLEPLDTIEGCVANIRGELINIVDYIDAKRNGNPIYVWPPERFAEFRVYTLSNEKRIDKETAKDGDGFLEPLLHKLIRGNVAKLYQRRICRAEIARQDCANRMLASNSHKNFRRQLPVVKEEASTNHEIISIHGTESECSSPRSPVKEESNDVPPWSPSSIGSSVIEILLTQTVGKRDLHEFKEEQDDCENEVILTSVNKRARF
ncbi:hypothetical protein NPX13_g5385 [Xylaria arbuscula]|uniref:Ribonuclease H1 N-terminal domain-containing protein n=1 Tax=Xylaria arbuscula TaxID=114810 RepID=A0A9W8TL21_9PEZI|nr:hypothetical protein NPX13_g5385 [Xylaria arbuscula]